MGRIAGDSDTYAFRLCRIVGGVKAIPTQYGFELPSSTAVIKDALAIPPAAMSYHGFREGLKGMAELFHEHADQLAELVQADDITPEVLEDLLKAIGITPNTSRDAAGDRGKKAHTVLECLAEGWQDWRKETSDDFDPKAPTLRDWAEALAEDELRSEGTSYGYSAIHWWDTEIVPHIESGEILDIVSERPVWSLEDRFAGTLDLAILWGTAQLKAGGSIGGHSEMVPVGWEIIDAKTHKPASGFSREGSGPGYDSDAVQIRSYRKAWEELGLGETIGQRIVVLRDRKYRGKDYLEDPREVPYSMFQALRQVSEDRKKFDGRM